MPYPDKGGYRRTKHRVDPATIVSDYRLSERVGRRAILSSIEGLPNHIEAKSGIANDLASIGVTTEVQDCIRTHLLVAR